MNKIIIAFFACIALTFTVTNAFAAEFTDNQLIIEPEMGHAPIIDAIHGAKKSIDLVMYALSDPQVIDALIAAQQRGVKVTILLQRALDFPQAAPLNSENDAARSKLQQAHVTIINSNPKFFITHEKAMIIDDQYAFIMTQNFTPEEFSTWRNFDVVTTDTNTIKQIQSVMQADTARTNPTLVNSNLVWSPENTRQHFDDIIDNAKGTLDIYAMQIDDQQVLTHLANAAYRGVKVRIIMPREERILQPQQLAGLDKFFNVRCSDEYYIHTKVIIADYGQSNETAYIGSANLTTSAQDNNRELGMISNNSNLLTQLESTFNRDWQQTTS